MRRRFRITLDSLERLPRMTLFWVSVVLTGMIFLSSYTVTADLRFSFFYLLPIALAAWFVGRGAGIFFSFFASAAWLTEALLEHASTRGEKSVAGWNTAILLGFFLILSTVLSSLREALVREKSAARLDPLTKIPNRRAFFELAEAEIQRVARYGGRFTVAYMDLDNFKAVNDRDGHETGDQVLAITADTLRGSLRVNDIVARLGGDEFIVLLPETGAPEAEAVFRKLEERLEAAMQRGNWPVTFWVGAATFEKVPESVDQMVRLVDSLMYSAKTSGKNRLEKRIIGA